MLYYLGAFSYPPLRPKGLRDVQGIPSDDGCLIPVLCHRRHNGGQITEIKVLLDYTRDARTFFHV